MSRLVVVVFMISSDKSEIKLGSDGYPVVATFF